MPFATEKLIAFGDGVRSGDIALADILQNSGDTEEEILYETKKFLNVIDQVRALNKRPKISRQAEVPPKKKGKQAPLAGKAGKAGDERLEKMLDLVSGLRPKENIMCAIYEELERSVRRIEDTQREMLAVSKRLKASGCDVLSVADKTAGRSSKTGSKNRKLKNTDHLVRIYCECQGKIRQ